VKNAFSRADFPSPLPSLLQAMDGRRWLSKIAKSEKNISFFFLFFLSPLLSSSLVPGFSPDMGLNYIFIPPPSGERIWKLANEGKGSCGVVIFSPSFFPPFLFLRLYIILEYGPQIFLRNEGPKGERKRGIVSPLSFFFPLFFPSITRRKKIKASPLLLPLCDRRRYKEI